MEKLSLVDVVANRLTSAKNLQGSAVGIRTASRSKIEDVDYTTEVSAMAKMHILQQPRTQILAPETIQGLLKG